MRSSDTRRQVREKKTTETETVANSKIGAPNGLMPVKEIEAGKEERTNRIVGSSDGVFFS